MELFATTAVWEGDGKLTVYDKTQGVQNVQRYLCAVFNMKQDDLRVVSPFVGGAYGSGLRPAHQTALAVLAARALERSVRVTLTRQQMFALGYRPGIIEKLKLGANANGTLDVTTHEAISMTSQYEDFARNDVGWSGALYKAPNASYAHALAKLDVPTPTDMRAPGGATGVYALECAMDELAVKLKLDPIELRLALLLGPRPECRHALHQQEAARVLPTGRGRFRLGKADAGAALDARRQRTGRLGDGDRHLGSHADEDRGAHRADGERARRGVERDRRHRHRHLHDHDAACRRHARPAAGECHREARRLDAAAVAGRRRLMDGGLDRGRDRRGGRQGAQGPSAACEEDAAARRWRMRSSTR